MKDYTLATHIEKSNTSIVVFDENQQANNFVDNLLNEHFQVFQTYNLDMVETYVDTHQPDLIICNLDFNKNHWSLKEIQRKYHTKTNFLFLVYDLGFNHSGYIQNTNLDSINNLEMLRKALILEVDKSIHNKNQQSVKFLDFKNQSLKSINVTIQDPKSNMDQKSTKLRKNKAPKTLINNFKNQSQGFTYLPKVS